MSLYHLIYKSRSLAPFTAPELVALLEQSRAHNRQLHVTGLLLHSPDGRFLQILEGEEANVRELYYQHIRSDPRHYKCVVIGEGSCAERSFADWSMGCRIAQAEDLHDLLQNSSLNSPPRPPIRPELMQLLLEFVARR